MESGFGGKMKTSRALCTLKKRMVDDENTGLTDQEIWYGNRFLIRKACVHSFIYSLSVTNMFRVLRIGIVENMKKIDDMPLLF